MQRKDIKVPRIKSLVKMTRAPLPEVMQCALASDGFEMNSPELFRRNIGASDKNDESENVGKERVQKRISIHGVQIFADRMRESSKRYNGIVEGNGDDVIMLPLVISGWMCKYDVPSLRHYGCKGNRMILEQEGLGEIYSQ